MTQPLFKVANHHAPDCGEPPGVDGDSGDAYYGYFENEYGEQAIYTYNHATGEATLRMGDAGWERNYRVSEGRPLGLVLSDAEATWLRACWLATGALKKQVR